MRAKQYVFGWFEMSFVSERVERLCRFVGHVAIAPGQLDPDTGDRYEQRLGKVGYEAWLRFYTPLCAEGACGAVGVVEPAATRADWDNHKIGV